MYSYTKLVVLLGCLWGFTSFQKATENDLVGEWCLYHNLPARASLSKKKPDVLNLKNCKATLTLRQDKSYVFNLNRTSGTWELEGESLSLNYNNGRKTGYSILYRSKDTLKLYMRSSLCNAERAYYFVKKKQ